MHLTFCIVIVKFRVLVLQEKNGSEVVFDNFDIDDIFYNILQVSTRIFILKTLIHAKQIFKHNKVRLIHCV